MRTALALIAAGAVLAGAPPAMAEPDRAGARELAAAVKEFRSGIVAQRDELQTLAARRELPVCLEAIRHVPLEPHPSNEAARRYVGAYTLQAFAWPIKDAAARFAEDLASARVKDRVLRRGRDALVKDAISLTRFSAPPADLCERLDAWRAAGYPAGSAPAIEDPAVDAAVADRRGSKDRAIRRSGRRLRKLGVKRRVVRLWSGTGLVAGINLGDDELPYGDAHVPAGPSASIARASGARADARALARATKRVRSAVLDQAPAAVAALDRLNACGPTLEAAPAGDAALAAYELTFGYVFEAWFHPAKADLARFERALARAEIEDRVLRAGRNAWLRELRAAQQFAPPIEDLCARVDAWARGGYVPDQVPKLDDPGLDELFALPKSTEKTMAKAGQRLRKLGVKSSVAKLWGGLGFLVSD